MAGKIPYNYNNPEFRELRTHLQKLMRDRFSWGKRTCERCAASTNGKRGIIYHRHLRNHGGKEGPEDVVWLCRACVAEIVARRKEGGLTIDDLPFVDPRFEEDLKAGRQPSKRPRGRPRKNPIEPERPKRKYTRKVKPEPENKDWSKEIQDLKVAIIQAGKRDKTLIRSASALIQRLNEELKAGAKTGEILKRYRQELASL